MMTRFKVCSKEPEMTSSANLHAIDDPLELFLAATAAINERQEDVDELGTMRARAIAALHAQGRSYKELADILGMSAPRVGQLISSNGAAAVEVLRAWAAIESQLGEIVSLSSLDPRQMTPTYSRAVEILVESGRIDLATLIDLDSIYETRSHVVHGAADITDETADDLLDKAIVVAAKLSLWIATQKSSTAPAARSQSSQIATGSRRLSEVDRTLQKIAQLSKDESVLRKRLSDLYASSAKARGTASTKRQQSARTSSASMQASYLRSAASAEQKAVAEERKIADTTRRLSEIARKRATAAKELDRVRLARERRDRDTDNKRRLQEKRHAQEVAQIASPKVHYVHEIRIVEPPRPEKLRVLYLTSNPDSDAYLRVDVEVREVRQAIRRAIHRDYIEIDHRPAATPEDLLDGVNEQRPHVIHFAGHGVSSGLLFDDAKVEDSSGRVVAFDVLARALAATDTPPKVVVLNACDTLSGAEQILDAVPVVIAMASTITDLAATAFSARFYSSVASAQSVQTAVNQGAVAVDLLYSHEGWQPTLLCREGIDAQSLILVQAPDRSVES